MREILHDFHKWQYGKDLPTAGLHYPEPLPIPETLIATVDICTDDPAFLANLAECIHFFIDYGT